MAEITNYSKVGNFTHNYVLIYASKYKFDICLLHLFILVYF